MIKEEAEGILKQRNSKLEELLHLAADPLLTDISSHKSRVSEFLNDNDITKEKTFVVSSLPGVSGSGSFAEAMLQSVSKSIYKVEEAKERSEDAASEQGLKRRTESISDDRKLKISRKGSSQLSDSRSGSIPKSTSEITKPVAMAPPVKSQKENIHLETKDFLNRDISELEILSVPEHYPTKPPNVSSLAELYYLTQTLPLIKLLPGSHKTLITENYELALLEGKIAVLYSRIEELKRQGKWSLRQPKRYYDPYIYTKSNNRKKTFHGDSLLEEGKWMAADFKEGSKYKKACCVTMAQAVNDYWTYGKVTCIRRKRIWHIGEKREEEEVHGDLETNPVDGADSMVIDDIKADNDSAPLEITGNELQNIVVTDDKVSTEPISNDEPQPKEEEAIESAEVADQEVLEDPSQDKPVDELTDSPEKPEEEVELSSIDVKLLLSRPKPEDEIVPPNLPTFTEDDLKEMGRDSKDSAPFKLHANLNDLKKIDQSIIKNLPKFTAFDNEDSNMPAPALKPVDSPMIAVSRLLHPFEEDDEWYKIVLKEGDSHKSKSNVSSGPPEYQKGLFGFQSHRRFNYLKPPKPPLIKNIEFRSPTIWLPQDDKHLIHYVAEFCFNWDLISEHLLPSAATLRKYESNIERRTPWQCFERYIQLNEKFQFSDMKGIYSYQAQLWLEHAHRAQLTTKRRISPLGVGNESIQRGHRRLRWASLFDAMRKSMKKREDAIAKLNHRRTPVDYSGTNTNVNSPEASNNGTPGPNNGKRPMDRVPTPAELSKLKFERDKSIQEAYLNQQATRSRMIAAVAQQQKQQQNINNQGNIPRPPSQGPGPNVCVPPQQRGQIGVQGGPTNTPAGSLGNQVPPPQQPLQAAQGGLTKRPTTPNGTAYTAEQIQQLLQIQKQRRLMQQQNQPGKTGINPSQPNTPALMQNMPLSSNKAAVGGSNIPLSGIPNLTQQVPLLQQGQKQQLGPGQRQQVPVSQPSQGQGSSSGAPANKSRIHFAPAQVSAIINSIQTKNPNLTKEQVTKLAATYLANIQQQQQNRANQQQQQPQLQHLGAIGQGPATHRPGQSQSPSTQKKPQVATLTPQERNQLQMLKAAKTAQQQQLQHQQQQQQQQQRRPGSPMVPNAPLDPNNMAKLEYEQRKNLLIQKHQQQQRLGNNSNIAGQSTPNLASMAPSSSSSPSSSVSGPASNLPNSNKNVPKK